MSLEPENEQPVRATRLRASAPWLVLALALVAMWARSLAPITQQSHTFDEAAEIAAGYVQLTQGFYAFNAGHPPLICMTHGLALLPLHARFAIDPRQWLVLDMFQAGSQFLYDANTSPFAALVLARLSTVVLATLLVLVAFAWSRRLFGPWGGALTALLLTFDPNLLAHSTLATTDLGIAAFMLFAAYCAWRYLRTGGRWWLAATGLTFGAACAGKLNALLLFPMLFGALLLVEPGSEARPSFAPRALGLRLLRAVKVTAFAAVVAALVVWAVYRFQVGALSDTAPYDPTVLRLLAEGFPRALTEWKVPAPWYAWCIAFQHIRPLSLGPFLLGRQWAEPTRLYAPVSFLLKTPLPCLLLLALGGLLAARPPRWCDKVVLYGGALVLAGSAVAVPTSPGYRHLLPALPLVAVALGGYARPLRFTRWAHALLAVMLVWLAATSLSVHPHYLAYFNEIAGGPAGGYRYLVDSDLDWGQDLPGLSRYLQDHGIETLYLDYFGTAPPRAYGIPDSEPLSSAQEPLLRPGEDPDRAVIAISATQLQCTGPNWPFSRAPLPYSWLKEREPIAAIGHSIFIYPLRAAPGDAGG